MKTKKYLLLGIVLILVVSTGCGETIPPPQPTAVSSPAAVEETAEVAPPAEEAPTIPTTTEAAPSSTLTETSSAADTAQPPTEPPAATFTMTMAAPHTPTLAASLTPAASANVTQSPAPSEGSGVLPQEGQWGGGGTSLVINFVIGRQGDKATIRDLSLVWFGLNDCEVNHRIHDETVIEGDTFTRYYDVDNIDDFRYTLTGKFISPTVVQGVFDLSYPECGTPKITWRATPKL